MKIITLPWKQLLLAIIVFYSTSLLSAQTCPITVTSYPYTQDFESAAVVDWVQDTGDNLNWTRDSGGTPSGSTGPASGDGDTWYRYIESSVSGTGFPNMVANYESPCFDLTSGITNPSFDFSYHMYGATMGTLNVDISTDNGTTWPTTLFTVSGQQHGSSAAAWTRVNLDLSAYVGQTVKIRFNGITGSSWQSDIAIDNIYLGEDVGACGSIVTTFPYSEGFESGLGAVTQDTGDNFDWTRRSGGTPSTLTGPTGAANGSWYLFTEASANYNNTANLETPCFDLTGISNPEFSFNYHMYGADMGTLNIDISTDSGATYPTNLWTQTGQVQTSNGQAWNNVVINLSAYAGQTVKIRIQGITGSSWNSDIAIDDFYLEDAVAAPEIDITGLGITIADGDATPSTTDDTDYGVVDVGVPVQHTFTINNLGSLNLTVGSITFSGANPGDFSVTTAPAGTVTPSGSTTFVVTFNPSGGGIRSATMSIVNNDSDENPYDFTLQGEGVTPAPLYTYYYENFDDDNGGWTTVTSTNDSWIWTNSFPTTELADGGFWRNNNFNTYNNNTNIVVQSPQLDFSGLQNLRLSVDVKCYTESTYDGIRILYSVAGGAYTLLGASGTGTNWYGGNVAALGTDGWSGDTHTPNPTFTHNQFIKGTLSLTDATFAGQNNVRFRIEFSSDNSTVSNGVGFDNFLIEADTSTALNDPTDGPANVNTDLRLWLKANEGIAMTDGADLTLWEDQAFDNASVDKEDASAPSSTAPTYRDNGTRNINFNPVADFDNTSTEYMQGKGGYFSEDYFVVVKSDDLVDTQTGTFSPGRQFAIGARYGDDSFHEDPTGLGFGSSTARYTDEVIAHNVNSFPNDPTSPPNDNSYGRAYTSATDSFNHVLIVNVKSNAARTQTEIYKNGKQLDNATGTSGDGSDLIFKEFGNAQFLLGTGRSGLAGRTTSQLNGMLSEVISYDTPNSATNQQRIQSYLGIKYGVTLQDASSAVSTYRENDVDYVDSDGDVIWDTSANSGHNFDIAGIGRDDNSDLNQKQSMSQNLETDGTGPTSGFLAMGLTQVYDTNNENISTNATTLDNQEFLVWGNNNASLSSAPSNVTVDMSAGITGGGAPTTEVEFTAIQRIWKVVETGGDVPTVQVRIPTSVVRSAAPPNGEYLMFISSSGVFDPTAQYRVMTESGGFLTAEYDFTGTEYITFGWAPEREFTRSIYFDPSNSDFVDIGDNLDLNPSGFTISTWIKRDAADTGIKAILSKKNASFSNGFTLRIINDNRFQLRWANSGVAYNLYSNSSIPDDEWHHVAVIYNGTRTFIYIDGVLDAQADMVAPNATTESFLIGAESTTSTSRFFRGNIDEVRVWDSELTVDQLRFIMNQEIEDNSSFVGGSYFISRGITPSKNDINTLPWNDLAGYYPMSTYTYTNTKDESGNGNVGALRNLTTVDWQTAPLPYISTQNGDWDDANTWVNGDVQAIPGTTSVPSNSISVDWNIVRTSHDVTIDNDTDLPSGNGGNRSLMALFVDSNELTIDGNTSTGDGYGLTVTHYLNLDGNIDLEGESQLIQTSGSDLEVDSSGRLERDQQGTADTFTYNYWTSPVGEMNTTSNNNSYTLPDVLMDGTNASSPVAINFITNSYDGTGSSPIGIADYWVWKFANQLDDDYSAWQHVRSTGSLLAGEGYTLKGPGSGPLTSDQNYTFRGKPNNGDISLVLNSGNDYLIGNPYPSAMDADEFISDNTSTSGTLFFWEHWGGGSHILQEYQGGYAMYNLSGGVPAPAPDPDVAQIGVGTKTPGRYIPVSQGFFVIGTSNGNINFENDQRVFRRESGTSVFLSPGEDTTDRGRQESATRSNNNLDEDTRFKIRLGLVSSEIFHRQLLVTEDENATAGVDRAYDGVLYDAQDEDLYWIIENDKYIIQGIDFIDESTILPLGIKISDSGIHTIRIEGLENIPEGLFVYVHDKELDVVHNLHEGQYDFHMDAGTNESRFDIIFGPNETLDIDEFETVGFDVYYANASDQIVLLNPNFKEITSIEMFNVLGQQIQKIEDIELTDYAEFNVNNISVGTYIIKVTTLSGNYSKKVLVE